MLLVLCPITIGEDIDKYSSNVSKVWAGAVARRPGGMYANPARFSAGAGSKPGTV